MGRWVRAVERVKGIEPSSVAWEATALPLSYTRVAQDGNPTRAYLETFRRDWRGRVSLLVHEWRMAAS